MGIMEASRHTLLMSDPEYPCSSSPIKAVFRFGAKQTSFRQSLSKAERVSSLKWKKNSSSFVFIVLGNFLSSYHSEEECRCAFRNVYGRPRQYPRDDLWPPAP